MSSSGIRLNRTIKNDIKALTEQLNENGAFTMPDEYRAALEQRKTQYIQLLTQHPKSLIFAEKELFELLKKGQLDQGSYENLQQKIEQLSAVDYEILFEVIRCWGIHASDSELQYPLKFSFNKEAQYYRLPASDYCDEQGYFY